jgi:phosphoribosyl-dephospho-CoA transferase
MEMNPHDLIKIGGEADLATDHPLPDWAKAALSRAPFVVVRRAEIRDGHIPVGIRGLSRRERLGAWLPENKALAVVTPYSLPPSANLNGLCSSSPPAAIRSFQLVTPFLLRTGYCWGPTGSVGFELVTNMAAVTADSDLDLLIDLPEILAVQSASRLMTDLLKISLVYVDVQLKTAAGNLSLAEYIQSERVLVKKNSGLSLLHRNSLW